MCEESGHSLLHILREEAVKWRMLLFFYCIFLTHRLEFLLGVKMNSFDFVFLGLVVQRVIQDDALNK